MKPIVILGMQRSGTSALAGALAKASVYFGKPEMLYEADGNNPQGYFEHRMLTALNLKILEEFGMHPTSHTYLPERWKEFPQAEELRRLLKQFIQTEFDDHEQWAMKQPLTSLVLPIYKNVFEELGISPHYVVCVRNPLESMESESKLQFEGSYRVMQSLGTRAIGSWLRYTLSSVCDAAPSPVTVVPYEELLSNPKSILDQLVDGPTNEAAASIRPNLRHNRRPIEDLNSFPSIVRQTYQAAISGQSDQLVELYKEFKTWGAILGEVPTPPGGLNLFWMEDGLRRTALENFFITPGWQTVEIEVNSPPSSSVSGWFFHQPARIWVRRCVWKTPSGEAEAILKCGPASALTKFSEIWRLDGAYESQQIRLQTPPFKGPYVLEIELLIETGSAIHVAGAARMAKQLEHCVATLPAG